jgi:Uma2 family endonuclease
MIGKDRLDLRVDPPPDLALEVDVTSKTGLDAYQALGVPELWRAEDGKLYISVLEDGKYADSAFSPHFPNFPIHKMIAQGLELAQAEGRSQALRDCRRQVQQMIRDEA